MRFTKDDIGTLVKVYDNLQHETYYPIIEGFDDSELPMNLSVNGEDWLSFNINGRWGEFEITKIYPKEKYPEYYL